MEKEMLDIVQLQSVDFKETDSVLESLQEYSHPGVQVKDSVSVPGQQALIAKEPIEANTLIFSFTNSITAVRTRTSIQVGISEHLEAGDFGSYTNHSCSPNAVIRAVLPACRTKATAGLFTVRPVNAGEELTFDYATTETDLTEALQKVNCLCSAPSCRGKVKCFHQISAEEQQSLSQKGLLAAHIHGLL